MGIPHDHPHSPLFPVSGSFSGSTIAAGWWSVLLSLSFFLERLAMASRGQPHIDSLMQLLRSSQAWGIRKGHVLVKRPLYNDVGTPGKKIHMLSCYCLLINHLWYIHARSWIRPSFQVQKTSAHVMHVILFRKIDHVPHRMPTFSVDLASIENETTTLNWKRKISSNRYVLKTKGSTIL